MDNSLITEQFKNRVKQAMKHPYVWPEIEELQTNEQLLAQKYLYGKLKKKDFERKISKLQSKVPSLIVNSLPELELTMQVLNTAGDIKTKTLQDMSFLYDQAIKQGYQCRFSIWFYKPIQKKGISMYCATQINIE